jgi:hypothetical protein
VEFFERGSVDIPQTFSFGTPVVGLRHG